MKRVLQFAAAAAATVAIASPLAMQQTTQVHPGKGGSPHVRSVYTVDGATITLEYGRPSAKGRTLYAPDGVVPTGKVWRMGADEATTLKTDKNLMFGNVHVSPGTYTLFALPQGTPDAPAGQLIINKQTGQWGTQYDESQDLGRVDARVRPVEQHVETLTLSIEDTPEGGMFVMQWGRLRAEVPFVIH